MWAAQCTICLFPHKNVRATRLGWGDGLADFGVKFNIEGFDALPVLMQSERGGLGRGVLAGGGSIFPHIPVRATRLR